MKKKTVSFSLSNSVVGIVESESKKQGISKSELVNNTLATNFALSKLTAEIQTLAMQLNEALQEFTEAGL